MVPFPPEFSHQAEFKAIYDKFFVDFANAHEKYVNKSKIRISSTDEFRMPLKELWITGWIKLQETFTRDGAYAMLSDRIFYLVKIHIYIVPKYQGTRRTDGWELQFLVEPTYLTEKLKKIVYNKVIPTLQALKYKVNI